MGKALVATLAGLTLATLWFLLRTEPSTDALPSAIEVRAPRKAAAGDVELATARGAAPDAQPLVLPSLTTALANPDTGRWGPGLETLNVAGRVLDEFGQPVPRAEVLLVPDPQARDVLGISLHNEWGRERRVTLRREQLESTRTDGDGRFRLDAPWYPDGGSRPGTDARVFPQLLVLAPGYAAHEFPCLGYSGGRFDAGDLQLTEPGVEVVARLVDPDGAPVAGASLVVDASWGRGSPPAPYPSHGLPALQLRSDAAGVLRVPNLCAEVRWLTVEHPHFEPLLTGVEPPDGGRHDLGTLVLDPLGWVRGQVLDAHGEPVEGAEVSTRSVRRDRVFPWRMRGKRHADAGEPSSGVAVTDAQGAFALGGLALDESRVSLVAAKPGVGLGVLERVPLDSTGVVLRLEPEARLQVRAVDAHDGRPVEHVELLALALVGGDSVASRDAHFASRRLETEGARVSGVGPGGTQLLVSAPGYTQRSFQAPGVPAGARREVEVPLQPARPHTLILVDDRGAAVPGARLDLELPLREASYARSLPAQVQAHTDAAGRALLHGLAEGRWHVEVEAAGHRLRDGVRVSLPAESGETRIELERTARIVGRVREATGEPAVGVHVAWRPGRRHSDDQLTDLRGRFLLEVAAGSGELSVARAPPHPFELQPGAAYEVELTLEQPFVLTGTVLAGGSPLAGAETLLVHTQTSSHHVRRSSWEPVAADGTFRYEVEHLGGRRLLVRWDGERLERHVEPRFGEREELVFDFGSGSLAGFVDGGGSGVPLGGLRITLRPMDLASGKRDPGWGVSAPGRRCDVAPDGGFRFDGLPPGRYVLLVSGRGCAGERWGPYEVRADAPGDLVTLRPELGAQLTGRAQRADGTPFRGVVRLSSSDGEHVETTTPTFLGGGFSFDALPAGTWRVELLPAADAAPIAVHEVTLAVAETREVVLRPGDPASR